MRKGNTLRKQVGNHLPLFEITPFSLQDFPDMVSCILWFGGCNLRCYYCHNPELVLGKLPKLEIEEVEKFLLARKGLLDGVVLSGGESTLFKRLPEFARFLKDLSYQVKVDTNGTNPEMILTMLKDGVVDYIALDYKAPKEKYFNVTQRNFYKKFTETLNLLCKSELTFEVRTTVHTDLLNEEDINTIIRDLESRDFKGNYYVQEYRHAQTLGRISQMRRAFDITRIKSPSDFKIAFRNFSID